MRFPDDLKYPARRGRCAHASRKPRGNKKTRRTRRRERGEIIKNENGRKKKSVRARVFVAYVRPPVETGGKDRPADREKRASNGQRVTTVLLGKCKNKMYSSK